MARLTEVEIFSYMWVAFRSAADKCLILANLPRRGFVYRLFINDL
jgi:hypothetical protein